jgi:hypothetical protein
LHVRRTLPAADVGCTEAWVAAGMQRKNMERRCTYECVARHSQNMLFVLLPQSVKKQGCTGTRGV